MKVGDEVRLLKVFGGVTETDTRFVVSIVDDIIKITHPFKDRYTDAIALYIGIVEVVRPCPTYWFNRLTGELISDPVVALRCINSFVTVIPLWTEDRIKAFV